LRTEVANIPKTTNQCRHYLQTLL